MRDRNEPLQAKALVNQLALLERVGRDGAFVFQFSAPRKPYDDDPRFDLDADSFSLVKSSAGGRHGTRYPDMTWEPKEAFDAVAAYYATHRGRRSVRFCPFREATPLAVDAGTVQEALLDEQSAGGLDTGEASAESVQ